MQFNTQFQAHYLSLSINLAMVQKVAHNGLKCWLNSSRLQCHCRSPELLYHACEASQRVGLQGSLQRSLSPKPSSTLVYVHHACDRQAEHAGYEVKEIQILVQVDSCYICDVNLFLCFHR